MADRKVEVKRKTKETDIAIILNLDGSGKSDVSTTIPFLDHMLVLFAKHGCFDLTVKAVGDIEIDYHHTFEDIGICLGQAFEKALGVKTSINRHGFSSMPMDEVLTKVEIALDISGRPYLAFDVDPKLIKQSKKQKYKFRRSTDIYFTNEFLKGFVNHAKVTLHVDVVKPGEIHHVNESIFKALSKALFEAVKIDKRRKGISSTKGKI